jgi:patatin-like phospholipase/acyl hydrolase
MIPAMVLQHIEEPTGKRIATMFDFIAGTSTS